MTNGIKAMGGTGRNPSIKGLLMAENIRERTMISPTAMPREHPMVQLKNSPGCRTGVLSKRALELADRIPRVVHRRKE
jgi:hypothetical protein